jgi:predicted nucleotidyltransferase
MRQQEIQQHWRYNPNGTQIAYSWTPDGPDVTRQDLIVTALRSGPPLRLAMLFGSTAKGTERIDSDIDIGIVPEDPELSLTEELMLQTDLSRVSGRQVDLVRLDRASTLLRWQVVRYGRALVEAKPFATARFTADPIFPPAQPGARSR